MICVFFALLLQIDCTCAQRHKRYSTVCMCSYELARVRAREHGGWRRSTRSQNMYAGGACVTCLLTRSTFICRCRPTCLLLWTLTRERWGGGEHYSSFRFLYASQAPAMSRTCVGHRTPKHTCSCSSEMPFHLYCNGISSCSERSAVGVLRITGCRGANSKRASALARITDYKARHRTSGGLNIPRTYYCAPLRPAAAS